MHLKRSKMPRSWPLRRKGNKYIVKPIGQGIPILIGLRDILKITRNRKEVKKTLSSGNVKVNGKIVRDDRFALGLGDNLSLNEKIFKAVLENRKFSLVESKGNKKTAKITGKKIINKGRMQINLNDGRNYIIKDKVKTGDSVVIDFSEGKIVEMLALKVGCRVVFLKGKHLGEEGLIEKIEGKNAVVKCKEKVNARLKDIMVIK